VWRRAVLMTDIVPSSICIMFIVLAGSEAGRQILGEKKPTLRTTTMADSILMSTLHSERRIRRIVYVTCVKVQRVPGVVLICVELSLSLLAKLLKLVINK
jgi:hypothetical protein